MTSGQLVIVHCVLFLPFFFFFFFNMRRTQGKRIQHTMNMSPWTVPRSRCCPGDVWSALIRARSDRSASPVHCHTRYMFQWRSRSLHAGSWQAPPVSYPPRAGQQLSTGKISGDAPAYLPLISTSFSRTGHHKVIRLDCAAARTDRFGDQMMFFSKKGSTARLCLCG